MKTVQYLFVFVSLLLQCRWAHGAVSIDTLLTTESTCQANGSVQALATGTNNPFVYSITNGPVTRPPQSSAIFNALPAGTYTVQVQNQVGESATATAVVEGSYQLMVVQPIPVIFCTGANQGYIIGNVVSGGKPPYTYQLVAPSPVTTAPQSSDTFYNLPDGSYTLRVTDNCGNFQTTGVVLSSVPSSLSAVSYANYLGCNNSGTVQLNIAYTNLQLPIQLKLYDDLGDSTVMVLNSFNGQSGGGQYNIIPSDNMIQIMAPLQHSVFGGAPWHAVVTNACGVTLTMDGYTASAILPISVGVVAGSCPPALGYSYTTPNAEGMYTLLGPDSMDFYLYDETLGAITDSFHSLNGLYTATRGTVTHTYHIIIVNSCGVTFTSEDWVWSYPAPPIVYPYPVGLECLDSTIAMEFGLVGFTTSAPITYIIHSGPASLHSSKPGFAYSYPLSYPDTLILQAGNLMRISNLPPGAYSFSIIDSCGQRVDSTFTIAPADLDIKRYSFSSSISGQCGIFNALRLFITRGDKYAYPFPLPHFNYTITNISTGQIIETNAVVDSIDKTLYNIPTGTYVLAIDFFEFPTPLAYLNDNRHCTTIYDTVVVSGSPFPHINGFVNSFCQSTIATEVQIDSTGGVAPYTYEVIAGPQTFPPQSSNLFYLPATGTYTFRMVDACGNSYVSATSIDTLIFPPVQLSATPCPGTNVLAIPVVSPFYTYIWQYPNGTLYPGDTLSLPNVSTADTGIYTITRYADIGGCKDTVISTLHLELLARVSQTITACYGDTIRVGTMAHYTPGTYVDTLTAAAGCDSIVTTQLSILPAKYDTISAIICQGQAVNIGGHLHYVSDTSVHLLQDTITASTGCDSIVTVHLTVKTSWTKTDTIRICQGDTLRIPIELHTPQTTITDTPAVTTTGYVLSGLFQAANGCDSSFLKYVLVSPRYFDVRFDTICRGDTARFGQHYHTQTGAYLDTLTSINGCDSIQLLLLTVRKADTTYTTKTICQGQAVNGHTTSGIYTDTLQTATGCDSIVILILQVSAYAQDSFSVQLCSGQSISFAGHTYNQSGIYRDTLAGSTCDSIVVLHLTVHAAAHDTLVRSICSGQSISVGAHTYNQSGTYTDTLATTGCDSVVTLVLTVSDYQTDSATYFICAGNSITVNGIVYNSAGVYRDTVSASPCDSLLVTTITVLPNPVLEAIAAVGQAAAGDAVQLGVITSETSLTYYWTGPVNNPVIANPVGTLTEPTWFVVTATDTGTHCLSSDSVFVDLEQEGCGKHNLFVPNIFTPNNDGQNDVFRIYSVCPLERLEVKIFNRWGEKVFESHDPAFAWDGYYKSALQTPAVFVYYLEGYYSTTEEVVLKGSVTLVR